MITLPVAPQFSTEIQQHRAATLGMWVFLATELMFFGPLFLGYGYGRLHLSDAFAAGSRETDVVLGTVNTGILLTSSFFVANAVDALERGAHRFAAIMLHAAIALGIAFLAIKGIEYSNDWQEGLFPGAGSALPKGEQYFFLLYFAMTGLHAAHLIIGIAILLAFAVALGRVADPVSLSARLRVAGLYWHFVDAVWIFLYPILYLVERSG
ncbi:MAG TPA: cytochrome c oxidase subunit 3 [Aromatoleum sp.]|uniref:cytochrome c oxidase subunit 3 n=1 Tax=Aromatoleum sp. TaxID=2307007 RepID=UPI002B4AA06F|nr:cytochrome c oxidase subunit 3 [Aromatoleum sp.]HJV26915.1 cytochrome c oxidase subunit 3 [Aromatoleum sp.]